MLYVYVGLDNKLHNVHGTHIKIKKKKKKTVHLF